MLVADLKLIPDLTEKSFVFSVDKKLFTIQGVRDIIYAEKYYINCAKTVTATNT